jgi:hypothetical protein
MVTKRRIGIGRMSFKKFRNKLKFACPLAPLVGWYSQGSVKQTEMFDLANTK